jgi:hypothetical protein
LITLLIIPVLAEAEIEIYPDQITTTNEKVLVRCTSYIPFGLCGSSSVSCFRTIITINVTPCPLGVSCVGDTYTFVTSPYDPTSLTLEFGTTYTFSGTGKVEVGYNSSPCTYSCTSDVTTLTPTTYRTSDGPLQWEVTPVSSGDGQVVVDARLKNLGSLRVTPCLGAVCTIDWEYFVVTPCPVDMDGDSDLCNGSHAVNYGTYHRVTLVQDQTYTFGGSVSVQGLRREMGGACAEPACSWYGTVVPLEVTATPLATKPITWGAVKAMYRSP